MPLTNADLPESTNWISVGDLATSLRPGIYLVDCVREADGALSSSLVLDIDKGVAIEVSARLPAAADVDGSLYRRANANQELTRVEVHFMQATIDKPFDPHCNTMPRPAT